MRLGDPNNFPKTRTSTSTVDDTLSGKADAASSDERTEDENSKGFHAGRPTGSSHSRHRPAHGDGAGRKRFKGENGIVKHYPSDESSYEEYEDPNSTSTKASATDARRLSNGNSRSRQKQPGLMKPPRTAGSVKSVSGSNSVMLPPSPYPQVAPSRTASVGSTTKQDFSEDDADLSTKPRCQRCRKSKKGCDRQRPCQRCKDAGIGIEGCVSEDEGNGRKGRYGRHMGVSLKHGDPIDLPTSVEQGGMGW